MGGADEGRAAYIMVALEDAATGKVIAGHEPERYLFTNVTKRRPTSGLSSRSRSRLRVAHDCSELTWYELSRVD